MIKAIFMDYYGTVACELGPAAQKAIAKVYRSGNAKSPEEILYYWWTTFGERLKQANGPDFRTQHDVAYENFIGLLDHFESDESPQELLNIMEEHWRTTDIHEDAAWFMDRADLPVYFVTNSDDNYVYTNVGSHHLHPAGIVTSEQARYSKPRSEIFSYALEKTGLQCGEVIHVGDSLTSDVECPQSVGIRSVWLNREGRHVPDGICSIKDFYELPALIRAENAGL